MANKTGSRDGKERLIKAGLALARKQGYRLVGRDAIAAEADCAHGLITFHFKDMDGMRAAIVQRAVEIECVPVIAEALAAKHPGVKGIPEALRKRVVATL